MFFYCKAGGPINPICFLRAYFPPRSSYLGEGHNQMQLCVTPLWVATSVEHCMGPRNVSGLCRKGRDATMRTLPLGPGVELPMAPPSVRGCAETGVTPPCEPSHWGLRRSSPWSYEAWEGCAETGVMPPCEPCRCGPAWSSLWGHERCDGVCRNGRDATLRTLPLGPEVEISMGPRSV